ncbi:MAG: methionine gamma-lyase family protein [Clostridia bacterium]|nr:methionine gamma-lyase family protein [Clostridia bacterium]
MDFSKRIIELAREAEVALRQDFDEIDAISFDNTQKILDSFRSNRVSESDFMGSTGYGYDDAGRDKLDKIYAEVLGAEASFVRHSIVNGTQALTIGLFGLLRPGDTLLSITGKPYDTLEQVIGISGNSGDGSLADFGINYKQVDLLPDGSVDYSSIRNKINSKTKVVFIQRSKGYLNRPTLSIEVLKDVIHFIKTISNAFVMVDNCYGEFTELSEPSSVGADLIAGSLIKNPGGGMAECGGYLAGTSKAVELCSYRLTSVGVGLEVGATLNQNKNLYKGLFYAPHTVAQALKTAKFAAFLFEKLGYDVNPRYNEKRFDIIQSIFLKNEKNMCAFCRGLQKASPVDSFATPYPWDMPGYSDKVIMAAGCFTSGSSIELSADGPIRPPYLIYLQGGLTYESSKIGIMSAAQEIIDNGIA